MKGRSREWAEEQKWFHSIDLGDFVTPGRFKKATPPNYTLMGFFEFIDGFDLSDATCVDVGTMDGISGFIMKTLGAKRVIATDMAKRETFSYARESLNLEIDYRVPVQVTDLEQELGEPVDLIVLAGILYHVFDPIAVIAACRKSLKTNGYLILETMYDFSRSSPTMVFNPLDDSVSSVERANVFWRPSKSAIEGMLALVGFEVVASVTVDARITFLARAKRLSEIEPIHPRLKHIYETYMRYRNYREKIDYKELDDASRETTAIQYSGITGDRRITRALYETDLPLQPTWDPPSSRDKAIDVARSVAIHASVFAGRCSEGIKLLLPKRLRGLG